MDANEYQIGGDHYSKYKYQHWDFATDVDLHCLYYGATKYLRWNDKDGVKDLRKCIHFLNKIQDRDVFRYVREYNLEKYARQLGKREGEICRMICRGHINSARNAVEQLIEDVEMQQQMRSYVNPEVEL